MLSLYQDPHFIFRFADDRMIPRFHLEGVAPGRPVSIHRFDQAAEKALEIIATAVVGEAGWVDLLEPILVRSGGAFVVVPEPEHPS